MGLSGVCIFFFVSGFAITYASINESPKQFLIRRLLRIFPLYILFSLLEFCLNLNQNLKESELLLLVRQLVFNFVMIGDFVNVQPNLSGVAWTLRLEMLFYGIVYVSMQLEKRFHKNVEIRVSILVTASVVFGFISKLPSSPELGNQYYVSIFFSIFIIGMVFAMLRHETLSMSKTLVLTAIALGVHIFVVLKCKQIFLDLGNYITVTILIIIFTYLIKINAYLEYKVIRFAQVTYSFYLLHTFFLTFVITQIYKLALPQGDLGIFFVSLFSTYVVFKICFFIFDNIENPLIQYSKSIN